MGADKEFARQNALGQASRGHSVARRRRRQYDEDWRGNWSADMTIKDVLLKEIETLPEARQADVLTYVRFLKIGLAEPQEVEARFVEALANLRRLAAAASLSEADIEGEIRAVRAKK